jgi:hypothetical protein
MAAAVVFMDWFQPLLSDVRVGNVNQLQLGLLTLFVWLQSKQKLGGRELLGGLVLGFGTMAKPNTAYVVLMLCAFWIANRRFKKLIHVSLGMAIAAVIAFVVSSAAFGTVRCWVDWLRILPQVSGYLYPVEDHNYSVSMLFYEQIGIGLSGPITLVLFAMAGVSLWFGRHRGNTPNTDATLNEDSEEPYFEDMLMVAIGCLIYLLSATLVWLHYFVLTVPMALIALRPSGNNKAAKSHAAVFSRILAAVAIVLIAELPVRALFSATDPRHSAALMCSGTFILFALAVYEVLRIGKMPAGQGAHPGT